MVCQCEVKRVARVVKASCLLMSRPPEWMRTQMGFLSGGLFFWPSLYVFGETWKPQLEWTGILLNEGRLRAFTQQVLNRKLETGQRKLCMGIGGSLLRWGQYNVNGPCCHQLLSPFGFRNENMFLDTNELTGHVHVCPEHVVDWYEMVVCTIVV